MGCAKGEEAYSIAILLLEHALAGNAARRCRSPRTSTKALSIAPKGRYPESIVEHLTPERLERFFIRQDEGRQVSRELRGFQKSCAARTKT